MKTIRFIITLTTILLSVSCASVYYDLDKSAPFVTYKTYAWLPRTDTIKNPLLNNQLIDKNIHTLINQQLTERGYRLDTLNPDILVRYNVMINKRESIVNTPSYIYMPFAYAYYNPYFFDPFYYRFYSPFSIYNNFRKIVYNEGTLIIDIIDHKKNQLVWHGWSVGTFNSPESVQQLLPGDINRIFNKYPVRPLSVKTE